MTKHGKARSDYDIRQPGDNPRDEARRAAADLCRLTRMWVTIAEANEQALNPTFIAVYDDENGEELPVQYPSGLIHPNTRREDLRREVRNHWPVWSKAVERLKTALLHVKDSDVDAAKLDARRGMMELTRIFYPPLILVHDEQPGDQLLRGAGPMFCRAGGRAAIQDHMIEKIIEPIADFSDLMSTYDILTADAGPEEDLAGQAGGTEEDDLRERRSAEWFAKVTADALYPDLLRNGRQRGQLRFSRKIGNFWHHSIDEICHKYPEYAARIRAEVAREAALA